ncbi:hypothetical protein HMPREF0860_0074 [Treponema socranskii subsp. socranskii VPI DR56BR1116 = ATCC 35536]|uniref:Uncharacterized protein n=1 Tax=Treponema socranskii subsp. socranskii VPI DR56BR1116 = ATCC 35536 TaxID=1125725 RepID=U2LE72_TRESO|nr:hypothetical protein [Treponema socranskii]ERF61618.1 hypothetical protein HMPREF1325_2322 [Treponema socranskii subsp. socranskii VPI DR56BR1116 = ATCC 35536]ERK02586.1 hypothetical protein HMPREF0860_0074 [Treponema socranskii subsp. socranskii VPI DR56BR1116 = ATCC 35536]
MTTSPIDIKHIYDTDNIARSKDDKGIVILTEKQKKLIDDLLVYMSEADAERVLIIKDRMKDLEHLARAIALFPSLLEQHDLPGGMRTPKTLVEMLIDNREAGDRTLLLPSKASLGKGFLVAKMHTFSSLSKQSTRIKAPASLSEELMTEAVTMMFSLLAEDVYLNLIADKTLSREIRRQWGYSLLMLWEYRTDDRIQVIAPILNEVWTARRKLAPAFGTMMGTSELLLISMQMDGQWLGFIKNKLSDPGVSQAMEEFLFGISYEQISQLRTILRTKGIAAIGRDEVADYLGTHIKTDAGLDYRDFYSLYTIRRDDARERARMKLQGPHKTLEDYFIQFVTEQNV